MMKEFLNNIFLGNSVKFDDLSKFIIEYAELCGIKDTTSKHVQFAIEMIQNGQFDLKYACKNYAIKSGMKLTELKDRNDRVIYTKIIE